MNKINIYAPCDGVIKSLKKLNDGVFSENMLGDGFYIEPKSNEFYSPINGGRLALIFETKHGYYFESPEGPIFLMHIGLETVGLKGKPFKLKAKLDDKLSIKKRIVDVDLEMLKKSNVSAATQIVLDTKEFKNWKFNLTKEGDVQQGEIIGFFEKKEEKIETSVSSFFGVETESKYKEAYIKISQGIGKNNYTNLNNCMTRLRFKGVDKTNVDESIIKSVPLVKGIIWNDNELQVVIGQDVYKVKSEFDKQETIEKHLLMKNNEKKKSVFKKVLSMFAGIMTQNIPVFIAAGLIQALIGLFVWLGWMPTFQLDQGGMQQIMDVKGWDIFWLILFATGKSTSVFLGIIVAYSASKYFDLRRPIGVAIGIIICSPLLYVAGGDVGLGVKWELFSLGKITVQDEELQYILDGLTKVCVSTGNLKIFVIIGAIYFAKKMDNWIGTWVHPLFELTVRPFLVVLTTCMLSLGLCMPLWNMFESVFSLVMFYVAKTPLGIGVGIYAALWQCAVLIGVHSALGIVGIIQLVTNANMGQGGYALFGAASSISVWAQLGAIIGVLIMTKEKELKRTCASLVPVGILGITEPIIYGVNLPKKRPFIAGISAAFIAGCFAGALKVTGRVDTGIGIFETIGFFSPAVADPTGELGIKYNELAPIMNGMFYVISCLVAVGSGILISVFLYKDKISEQNLIKGEIKKILKLVKLLNPEAEQNYQNIEFSNLTKEEISELKKLYKVYLGLSAMKSDLKSYKANQIKFIEKNKMLGKKLVEKNQITKAQKIKIAIEANKYIKLIADKEKEILIAEKMVNVDSVKKIIDKKMKQWETSLKTFSEFDETTKAKILNNFENLISWNLINLSLKEQINESELINLDNQIKELEALKKEKNNRQIKI